VYAEGHDGDEVVAIYLPVTNTQLSTEAEFAILVQRLNFGAEIHESSNFGTTAEGRQQISSKESINN
jgi:hypothetical protein